MLTGLSIATPSVDRGFITSSGILSLTEDFYREGLDLGRSRLKVSYSGISYSGVIERLYYEIYEYEDSFADNVIEFLAVPSGLETIEIAGRTYTFVSDFSPVSGMNQVLATISPMQAAYNLYNALIGAQGAGSLYSVATTPHANISGLFPDTLLYLQAVPSGITGNGYSITTTSDTVALRVVNPRFSRAADFEFKDPYATGYIVCSGNLNTDYYLPDLPSSDYGLRYMVKLYFANGSGLSALNSLYQEAIYLKVTPKFYGQTSLPSFIEVSGLACPGLVGGALPSDGVVTLTWDDMHLYSGLHGYLLPIDGSNDAGTYECTRTDLGQKFKYLVLLYRSNTGFLPPLYSYPRASEGSRGQWYFMGFTEKNTATIHIPPDTRKYTFWVGFGNSRTLNKVTWAWVARDLAKLFLNIYMDK